MTNLAPIAPKVDARATSKRVGRNVRYIMGERDLSQIDLARLLDVTESSISRRLNGRVDFSPYDLETVAHALRVPIDLLFTLKLPHLDSNQEPIG